MRKIIIICLLIICHSPGYASSDAGIDIRYGSFSISVLYSVAADYDGTDEYIRNPRYLLYGLISFIHSNADLVEAANKSIRINLYEGDYAEISGTAVSKVKKIPVYKGQGDFAALILSEVCSVLGGECELVFSEKYPIYECEDGYDFSRIRFGSFPSDSLNEKYSLSTCGKYEKQKIYVNKKTILKYFDIL